jgi:hypothetical protein
VIVNDCLIEDRHAAFCKSHSYNGLITF